MKWVTREKISRLAADYFNTPNDASLARSEGNEVPQISTPFFIHINIQ